MKNKRFTRVFTTLLCAVLVMMIFPITASADTGPKPSVRITFENLGDGYLWTNAFNYQDRHDHREIHRPLRTKHRGLPQVRPNAE